MRKVAFLSWIPAVSVLCSLSVLVPVACGGGQQVHMANGIKTGEVTSDSAVVWVRLTQHPEADWEGKPITRY